MRGRVAQFNPDRASGFIRPIIGAGAHFHIKESAYERPQAGDYVEYQPDLGRNGRIYARAVQLVQRAPRLKNRDRP
jgi:cold shock CspA family protein